MALLGFTVFKEKILDGSKRQTIRKLRKSPIKIGEELHLYWKLRTRACEKLIDATCSETFFITPIVTRDTDGSLLMGSMHKHMEPDRLDDEILRGDDLLDLARRDGFTSFMDMIELLERMHGRLDGNKIFQVIRW